ncbi:MAG: TenA family protein [Truepera sp.]|nr:TenA family protein [Truepera sp.]
MNLSYDLWQANQDLVGACLQNPFVQGLAEGSLPKERFAFYLGQDALFLMAFARAYSIAAARAPEWDGFSAFHKLAGGVLAELKLHEGYAAAWGVKLQETRPVSATRRYTDFLLATAWQHEAGVTATAMTPCLRLYAFLGQELARGGIPEHPYTDWIRTYSAPTFEALAARLERLLDRYAKDCPLVRESYRYALDCELAFFEAA